MLKHMENKLDYRKEIFDFFSFIKCYASEHLQTRHESPI